MNKFTRGPWNVSVWKGDYDKPMAAATGVPIAITHPCPACDTDECEANAHLIAAAPDMYEMLERMYNNALEDPTRYRDKIGEILIKERGES